MKNTIEKDVLLNAPIEAVWRALTDYKEFGAWFRVALTGPFAIDQVTRGTTKYPGYEGKEFWAITERMDEPAYFCFRWPVDESTAPDDPDLDRKTTLVEFRLDETQDSTRLTVRESGFSALPEDRRIQTYRRNEGGWTIQMENIRAHLESK